MVEWLTCLFYEVVEIFDCRRQAVPSFDTSSWLQGSFGQSYFGGNLILEGSQDGCMAHLHYLTLGNS